MKKLIPLILIMIISGCGEYIPTTVFEIETKDGQIIKLACPVVDPYRSKFTYLIDTQCVIHKERG